MRYTIFKSEETETQSLRDPKLHKTSNDRGRIKPRRSNSGVSMLLTIKPSSHVAHLLDKHNRD